MKLTVEFYGRLKAEFGQPAVAIEVSEQTQAVTIEQVYLQLCQTHQCTANTQVIRPILNDTFANWDDIVKANDVIGLFPPASGG
jgi:molybdopterin converting factor small subunit